MPQYKDANGWHYIFPTVDTVQVVAVGATSAQSASLNSASVALSLCANTNCWVQFGSNPTAAAHTAPAFYLPAGTERRFCIDKNAVSKIAVIQDSAAGYLSLIEHA
jgi:hypothetical protein